VIRGVLFLSLLELVRRGRLREKYSLLLLLIGGILLLLSIFDELLVAAADFLQIRIPPSFLVSLAFVVTFAVQIAQAVIISTLSLNTRDLAQKVAEQDWQIRQLRDCARILIEREGESKFVGETATGGAPLPTTESK